MEKEFKDLLLEANCQEPPKISKEEISKAIKGLKRKKAADRQGWKSEWVLEGGPEMISSLQILFSRIQEERQMPDQWNKMTIRTIHKKGSKKDLKNQRGIFLANILYKCFERVIIANNQTRISNCMTEFQCGGRKGMSTIDNVMAISGLIERNRTLKRNTYLFFGDAKKCFDKLWLKDCLLQLKKGGMPHYDLSLLFMLNKEATIQVRTPHGETRDILITEAVKQGTISGPMLCGVEMDRVNLSSQKVKAPYGPNYNIGMPGFVDNLSGGGGVEDATAAIQCCRSMESRKVTYNIDKTIYYGNKDRMGSSG